MDATFGLLDTLPTWVRAALSGAIVGSGLIAGMVTAMLVRPHHGPIARVMAFGAGVILGTVSVQLIISASRHTGPLRLTLFLLLGSLLFSLVNVALARFGARHRKRCGACVAQENERDRPGSGLAIAVGTAVDAVPEGLVLGVTIAQGVAPTVVVVAGFFLANVPEALSASAGMRLARRSRAYILLVWLAASMITPLAAVAGSLLLATATPSMTGALDALSAGILLAMAAETMIPEAFDKGPLFSGTVLALGFTIIVAATALG